MTESILTSIKKLLGLSSDYNNFDHDIILHINSVIMILTQLGVGPSDGFRIEDDLSKWNEFIDDEKYLDAVKSFTYLKVKLLFDPPLSSAAIQSIKELISELEWRITTLVETK